MLSPRRRQATRRTIRGFLIPLVAVALVGPVGGTRANLVPAFVRVDQVGFAPAETKTAYLLSPRDATGARVTAVDAAGTEIWSGTVAPGRGPWNSRYRFVQPIDLTALRRTGTYRLRIANVVTAESPPFRVGPAPALYGPLAANAVRYFQQHRDDAHPADRTATVYAAPSFDTSGHATGPLITAGGPVDVEGGWYDAGDYEKFTHTAAYALILMLLVQRDRPAVAGLAAEIRHGLDWLDKMWDGSTRTLYAQVGIGVGVSAGNRYYLGDHDTWRLPQADTAPATAGDETFYQRHRPVFRAAEPGGRISPNLAGRVAAAFALAAQVEATAGDETRARAHLAAAAQIFALGDARTTGDLVTTLPRDFYPEDTWHDDLALAATELARAGRQLNDPRSAGWELRAAHWARAVLDDQYTDTLSVYDVSVLADAELGPLLTAAPVTGAEVGRADLDRDLGARVAAAVRPAGHDPFGAADGSGGSDYTALELGYAATADLYRTATGSTRYAAFATAQRGVALGANGWGTSLVVGAGSTYPRCPHDQISDLTPGQPEPIGAVVNGPNSTARVRLLVGQTRPSPCTHAGGFAAFNRPDNTYTDDAGVSANTEPAIDFTATGLFAFALAADRP